MLKTQRQIVERQLTIQEAIEQDLKQVDDRLRSGEWGDCSQGEQLRRSLLARTEVIDRALERPEVKKFKRLSQHLQWERQLYRTVLADLREHSETEYIEMVPPKEPDVVETGFTPATQQEIDAVLNPPPVPFSRKVTEWFKEWRFSLVYTCSHPISPEEFIVYLEEELRGTENSGRLDKDWERLSETQKQIRILEKKILVCEKAIALGVGKKDPAILRYALRAKECYTVYRDALKVEASSL